MENKFNKNKYSKEKIFTAKKPASRVMIEIINELREIIAEKPKFSHKNYINYQSIKRFKGDYYLLRENSSDLMSIEQYIKDNPPSIRQLIEWGITISMVVFKAVESGFNLPDITVQSLFVDQNKNIKILAPHIINKIKQYRKDIESPLESIKYKAPEVINGSTSNEQTTIYSFGILFYYLTTGESPFRAKNKTNLYDKILSGSIIEPHYFNHKISAELNEFIMKLLSIDRKKRFKKWDEVIKRLEIIKNDNLYVADDERQKINKRKSDKIIKANYIKDKIRFFFRHHWKKVTLLLFLIIALIYAMFISGPQPAVTKNNTPQQVVKIFYQGINNNDITSVEDATTVKLGKLNDLVSESYILGKMKNIYSKNPDNKEKIMGIKELQLEVKKQLEPVYIAEYVFFIKEKEGKFEAKMKDILSLEKVNHRWQITTIRGDLKNLIEGNFNQLQGVISGES